MLSKNALLITVFLLLLQFDLGFGLKSINFCAFRNKEHECRGQFSYKCESFQICSKNKTDCLNYNLLNSYVKLLFEFKIINPQYSIIHEEERRRFKLFNKHIENCKYKFEPEDFCLNGAQSTDKKLTHSNVNYECPKRKSFKCGNYCATNSYACNYHKSNGKSRQFFNIAKCANQKLSLFRFFNLWKS
jgi:hypothetical protein